MQDHGSVQDQASLPAGAPAWKRWLALTSLLLCSLLWLSGLAGSLKRPTVLNALQLRQLELAALAAPVLPAGLQSPLLGTDPLVALRDELDRQVRQAPRPAAPELQLQLALLTWRQGDLPEVGPLLETLAGQATPAQRPLIEALLAVRGDDARRLGADRVEALAQPWTLSNLQRQLLCEQLATTPAGCAQPTVQRAALWRLLGATGLPALLALLGLGLLGREGWLFWRRGFAGLAPLQGPGLDPVDLTLLIAGGFVVAGELLTPLLLPVLTGLVGRIAPDPALAEGLKVLGGYLALMVVPLLILRGQLRSQPLACQALQWHWRPLAGSLGWALSRLLMVLPPVALTGWLVDRLVGDGGGSNPLLELVLTTRNPLALGCFALTALVLAPLFEETLFRGVLLPGLARRWGRGWGLLVSALTFAAAHLSVAELPALLVLGLGLGWLRLRSGRLGSCVLMHACWNGLTFFNLVMLAG